MKEPEPPIASISKRPRTRTLSETTSASTSSNNNSRNIKKAGTQSGKNQEINKKQKTTTEDHQNQDVDIIKEQLRIAADSLQPDPSKGSLNIDFMANFIHECKGKSNLIEIARKYTQDPLDAIEELSLIENLIVNKNIKNRITRIITRIKEKTDNDIDVDEHDFSVDLK
ncbi:hypothetical protein QAD02_000202 [Eretmocerus hayati]|uniref:Uncharacterized protein n=2 Tax=Eretmocerus hayati TaxID=131215 RepID=A0ACC2NDU0_9HYME|nr:hypothetical protein QAD02_009606 [Eretmocerus hayati]KAJ8668943.1 hypothetical protein QAD02_000202 [Eretmocerus hayati]